MAKTISRFQDFASGKVLNSKHSIVNSEGDSLIMETTAMAATLWIMVDH